MRTCKDCEYFDAEYGDCLNRNSPRFQTKADDMACISFADATFPEGDDTDTSTRAHGGSEC